MLIIIPARGGSKTVRRKNLQPVAGKPLFLHVTQTAREAFPDARIVVSTDDSEIASVAQVHGFEVHQRSEQAASDSATIADVVAEVVADTLHQGGVLVVQPTVPQITVTDLRLLPNSNIPAVLGNPHRHITWQSGMPLTERANRQENMDWPVDEIGVYWLPDGIDTVPRTVIEPASGAIVDVDTWADLETVRRAMEPSTVLFRFRANREVGAGHLHRCLALASELQQHHIVFGCDDLVDQWAWERVVKSWVTIGATGVPFRETIKHRGFFGPVVVVNDILDTTIDDVLPLVNEGFRVVNLEDHGTGGRYADLVINALYHPRQEDEHGEYVYGPRWAVLRPEFLALPEYEIRSGSLPVVLGLFGGTDPSGIANSFAKRFPDSTLIRPGDDISVAAAMMNHDILVTSAGRTVYEAAAVGIPTIVLAQNQRETTHSHLAGTVYLGLGVLADMGEVEQTIENLWAHPELRREMSQRGRGLVDGKGARRIAHRINGLLEGL